MLLTATLVAAVACVAVDLRAYLSTDGSVSYEAGDDAHQLMPFHSVSLVAFEGGTSLVVEPAPNGGTASASHGMHQQVRDLHLSASHKPAVHTDNVHSTIGKCVRRPADHYVFALCRLLC